MLRNGFVAAFAISLAAGLLYAAEENKPVAVSTKLVTIDALKDWTLPELPVIKFEGQLPIKDSSGSAVKGRFDKENIYTVNAMTGARTFKAGDKWEISCAFP